MKGVVRMNSKFKCDFNFIGKRIGISRKAKGITQEQLSKTIGITQKHMSEIERGVSGISLGTFIEITDILNVSADYLLFGKESKDSPISNLLTEINPQQRYYAEQIINSFVNGCKDT